MKKLLFIGLLFVSIVLMGGCEYDDSNDIDIITPVDSTETGRNLKSRAPL